MAAIAAMWRDLVENYSERTLWMAGAALHTVTFVAFNVGLYFMHRYQILARYKIQPLKYPTDELIRKGLVVRVHSCSFPDSFCNRLDRFAFHFLFHFEMRVKKHVT
jgi:hypothetical protein